MNQQQELSDRLLNEIKDLVDYPTYELIKRKIRKVRLEMTADALTEKIDAVLHTSEDYK